MARPNQFVRQEATNYDLTLLQDRLQSLFIVLENCPLLEGRTIEDIELVSGVENKIEHGLNRVPEGWIVVDQFGPSGDITRTDELTNVFLPLTSTSTQTVALWVF